MHQVIVGCCLGGPNKHHSLPGGDRKFAMVTRTEETETMASVWKRHSASGNMQPTPTNTSLQEGMYNKLGSFVSQTVKDKLISQNRINK